MGLLERAREKKEETRRLRKIVKKPESPDNSLTTKKSSLIKEQIKKEEKSGIMEPKVTLSTDGVTVSRPKGTVEVFEKAAAKSVRRCNTEPPIKTIKESIEKELKGKKKAEITTTGNRMGTGIAGLDGVMGGGFKTNSVNLVVGGPGSGKSTFAMQFLVNGIDLLKEAGVYISFEQKEADIIKGFKQFGWNLEEKVKDKQLVFLTYSPEQVEKVLEAGGGTVRDVIESIKARRIVVDSLTAFTLLHKDALAQRKACIDFFESIKKWNCTALLVAEQEPDPEKRKPTVEEFEVDGVILLYNIRMGDIRERALEVFKMRGTKHSAKLFPMTIGEKGVQIYPEQTVF